MGHRVKLLLDTHAFLYWCNDDPSLSRKAARAIASAANHSYISAVTIWEMAIKTKSGKMNAQELLDGLDGFMEEHRFSPLPISIRHSVAAGALPPHHKDPFDRMLAAQAQLENLVLVSKDRLLDAYGIQRLW